MVDITKYPEGLEEIIKYMDYIPETPEDPDKTKADRMEVLNSFLFHSIFEA